MRKRLVVALVCAVAVLVLGIGTAAYGQFSGLVLFGDSLTDVGNVHNQTFGISPQSPPYYQGRYSNGPLWAEKLALDLNLPAPTPSRLGGRDYAYGGTKTGSGSSIFFPFSFPNIGSQINQYLGSNTPNPDQLFVVWGGGNDFIDGQSNPQVPVNNISNHVTTLANAGATSFLVPNLPPLGQVPRFKGTASEATMDSRSLQFNSLLATALSSLESSLSVNIFKLDIGGLFHDMLTNPSAYGFTNVTGTALVGNTPVSNPDEYAFWDDIHPTRVAHAYVGTAASDLVTTHAWVSTQPGGSWSTPANWDPAGIPAPEWIAHVVNNNIPSAQAVAVDVNSTVRHVLVRGDSGAMTLIIQSIAHLSAGTIHIAQNGRISLQGGTLSASTLSIGAGGALSGTGEVAAHVIHSAGTLSPGEPGSVLRIRESYTQGPDAQLVIDLAGTLSGQHDILHVDGAATLAGTLAVRLVDNFIALPGQSFLSMTFASRNGEFGIINETGFAGLRFESIYTDTSLTLLADALGGDANLDGIVNLADFNILAANFGASGANWLLGDFTGDGLVNLADFNVLAGHFGQSAGAGGPTPGDWANLAASVPEPSTGGLLCLLAAALALPQRRRRR